MWSDKYWDALQCTCDTIEHHKKAAASCTIFQLYNGINSLENQGNVEKENTAVLPAQHVLEHTKMARVDVMRNTIHKNLVSCRQPPLLPITLLFLPGIPIVYSFSNSNMNRRVRWRFNAGVVDFAGCRSIFHRENQRQLNELNNRIRNSVLFLFKGFIGSQDLLSSTNQFYKIIIAINWSMRLVLPPRLVDPSRLA